MTKQARKTKLIQVPVNEGLYNKVLSYMQENDLDSVSEAARDLFRKGTEVPAYISVQKERLATAKTPEEKIQSSVEKEVLRTEAKAKLKEAKQKHYCELMGGTISPDGYCEFSQFVEELRETIEVIPQKEPLENIHEFTHQNQYITYEADTPAAKRARIELLAGKPQNAHINLPNK